MDDIKKDESKILYRSRPKKEIAVPREKFEEFWKRFDTVAEIIETDEWKEIYSNYYDFSELEKTVVISETMEEIEAYDANRQTQEIIKCANDFSYFCIKYGKINHPIAGLINLIPYTYQKRVIDCYGKHRFNILSKFRQGGLTTISVMWALWRCLFKTGQRIMVVSKTDREAIAAGEVAKTAMERLPSWLKPDTDKCNEHEKQFKTTSSVLWFYTVEAARGKSITILIIDEAAFINDMHTYWKALYPVLSTGGACEVVSTVNGLGNWYEETYHEAEAGKNPFNIIELDYWEHPLYNDPRWISDTRSILGEKGWQQEIERDFLSSGDTWINGVILTALTEHTRDNMPYRMQFEKWRNKGSERKNEWDDGALWIWKEPKDGHEYIIGADCAEGVGDTGDNSCAQVIDQGTLEQVAEFYSNTIPPHVFAQTLNHLGYYYNTALVVVENANQGTAVLSTLQHDLAYEHLYYDDNKQESAGIKTSKNRRPLFLQSLQQRLLNGTLGVNSYRLVTELSTFWFNPISKRPEANRGKHDDAIIALALACYIRDALLRGLPIGAEMPDEMMQIFKSEVYEEIRKEILDNDKMENYLTTEDTDELTMLTEFEKMLPKEGRKFKRRNDAFLREFGF
jgi:hypothetical protein